MRKVLVAVALTILIVSGTVSSSGIASALSAHVARTSCTTMGMTPASLRAQFGTVAVTAASYECGLVGDGIEVTLYLYQASERAAVGQEVHIKPAHRIGGLGAGNPRIESGVSGPERYSPTTAAATSRCS
jgi:hypothetical protein